jgi:hypothetical protein
VNPQAVSAAAGGNGGAVARVPKQLLLGFIQTWQFDQNVDRCLMKRALATKLVNAAADEVGGVALDLTRTQLHVAQAGARKQVAQVTPTRQRMSEWTDESATHGVFTARWIPVCWGRLGQRTFGAKRSVGTSCIPQQMVHQRFDQQIRCALYWWCCRHCFEDFDRVRAAPAGNVI